MDEQTIIDHEGRVSQLEARCDEYNKRAKDHFNFIVAVNKKADRHERYFNYLIGGWVVISVAFAIVKWLLVK